MDAQSLLEAERRQIAGQLEEGIIRQLNLTLAQLNAYSQTLNPPVHVQQAMFVLESLLQQALQQARDLENKLRPSELESLGLEAALQALANQMGRRSGVWIQVNLPRLRERLPPTLELILLRAAQDMVDDAIKRRQATRILIQLHKNERQLTFQTEDDGTVPQPDSLGIMQAMVRQFGGEVNFVDQHITLNFELAPAIDLTERELEVLQLAASGMSNREIADELFISSRTVKFHLDNCYAKLGVNSRTEASVLALRYGWIKPARMDSSETP